MTQVARMPDPRPTPQICPFLIAAHDPDSVLNYPSAENLCAKLGDSLSVSADYQANYCLRTRHWFCPVFIGKVKNPPVPISFEEPLLTEGVSSASPELALPVTRFESLPRRGARSVIRPSARSATRSRQTPQLERRMVWIAVLLLLLIGGAIAYGVARGSFAPASPITLLSTTSTPTLVSTAADAPSATLTEFATETVTDPFTNTPVLTATASLTASTTFTVTAVLSATITPTSTATNALKRCVIPADWQPYTVAVGETYYKISVKFGTTVDALQHVNCLADPGHLLAGQTISVPPHSSG